MQEDLSKKDEEFILLFQDFYKNSKKGYDLFFDLIKENFLPANIRTFFLRLVKNKSFNILYLTNMSYYDKKVEQFILKFLAEYI